jgi:hypothetical protein
VVSGNGQDRRPQRPEETGRILVLVALRAVREVAAGDDQRRLDPLDQRREAELDLGIPPSSEVQIRHVENPGCHDRGRL